MNEDKTIRTDAGIACECVDKLASECKLNPTAYQNLAKEKVGKLELELESAKRACAEKDEALNECLTFCTSNNLFRSVGEVREIINHALCNHAGEEYVHKSEVEALRQILGAIEASIDREYSEKQLSQKSDDILDNFGEWVTHHSKVELERDNAKTELKELRKQVELWEKLVEINFDGDAKLELSQLQEDKQRLDIVLLAVDNFLAEGRPHGGRNTQFPDGCECDLCQNWDTLNKERTAIDAMTKEGK